MKFLNYLYYNIYCWYHIDGKTPKYKNEKTAAYIAAIVMAGAFCFWIMLLDIIITYSITHNLKNTVPKLFLIILAGIIFVILYLLFIRNDKYLKIYDTHKQYDVKHKSWERVISIGVFIALPILSYLLLALILEINSSPLLVSNQQTAY